MAKTPKDEKRPIPTGDRSMAAGKKDALKVRQPADSTPAVWMGPGVPADSSLPPGTPTRAWEFPQLFNVLQTPKSTKTRESEGIDFSDLRTLSTQTDVRSVIEKVKDKQCKREWIFTVKAKPGERPGEAEKRAFTDPRIAEVSAFFEEPDGEHDFAEWLRAYLEDVLVLDAGTIYNWQSANGKPFALEVWDGATIEPLIDEGGRTPRPPLPAYQQWLYGVPGEKFTTEQLLYRPRNPRPGKVMGFGAVEWLLMFINIAARKDLTRLAHFTDGNIPAGLLPMPTGWTSAEIEVWFRGFNAFVQGLPANLVKLMPIPGGSGQPVFPQTELLAKDTWEESWKRLVCFAFGVPVSSLVKELTRANGEADREQADEEGEQALTDLIRRRLNWIVRRWFGYADIVAKPRSEMIIDATKQSTIYDLGIRNGSIQIDEVREAEGREPLGLPEGFMSPTGFQTFDASIAAAEMAATQPAPAAPAVPNGDKKPAQKADKQRVAIPLTNGKLLKVYDDEKLLTKRGSVAVDELRNGDELVELDTRKVY